MLDVETSSPLAAEEFELPNIEASSTSRSSSHPQDVSGAAVAPGRKSLSGGTRSGRRTITIPASPTPTNIIFTRRDDDDHGLDIEDIEAGPSTTTNPRRPPPGGRPKGKQHRRASSGVSNTTPDTPQGSHRRMLHLPADSDGAAVDPIFSLSRSKTRDLAAAAGETVEVPHFSHFLGLHHTAEEGETDNYARAARMRNGWKRRLFLLMEEPGSSSEAFAVHVVVTGSIVFSALLTILSTLPSFHSDAKATKALFGLDTTLVVLFTLEYMTRLLAHTDSWRMCWSWATSFFAIVDLLAVLPYYIEVALQQDTTILFRFSILRTLRLLRVFRAFSYQNKILFTIEVMYIAIHRSKDALMALAFFMLMALVVFSTCIYFAERGAWDVSLATFVNADGDPSEFDSIFSAAWFVLCTITTVGYGDLTPRSILGRLFTIPLLVFGLLLIALPSFVLGRNFAIVFDAMQVELFQPNASIANSARASFDSDEGESSSRKPTASTGLGISQRGTMKGGEQYSALHVPSTASAGSSSANLNPATMPIKMMSEEDFPPKRPRTPQPAVGKDDVKNGQLALNQKVLLGQIEELRSIAARQGETINHLVRLVEAQHRKLGLDPAS